MSQALPVLRETAWKQAVKVAHYINDPETDVCSLQKVCKCGNIKHSRQAASYKK